MRYIFSLALIALSSFSFGTDFIAVASGNWNASGTWSTDGFTPITCSPCVAGTDYPGGSDDAWTNGFAITVNSSQAVRDIMVEDVAGSLVFAGQLTVNGALVGWSGGQFGFATDITSNVLSGTSSFLFTANDLSNAGEFNLFNSEVIGFWNNNAPISVARFQLSQAASIDAGFSGGNIRFTSQFNLISGNLSTGFFLSGLEVGAQFLLGANTNFSTTVPIHGIAGVGANITVAQISSGATFELATSDSYINASTFRLLGTATFNVAFSGANQQQGWWYQTSSPSTTTIQSGSTIIFGATADQNIPALTYGNLYLQGSGNRTLGSTGTLIVQGDLQINSGSITFVSSGNSNPVDILGDLDNNGTWSPSQLVVFSGTIAQSIGGNNMTSFGGGVRIENTSATVSLNNIGIDINGQLDVDPSATFSPSDQIAYVSGNMIVDGTLSAGTDPSGFIFDGTTSFLGSGTRNFNDFTVTGTVTAPSGTLTIGGDFADNGTFDANGGTVAFGGTQNQSISGSSATSFENINITNSTNSVSVSSAKNLIGIITLSSGSTFNAGGNLTLVSDASGDATVAAIPSDATFSGNVIYQRYIDLSTSRWANIGVPIPTSVSNISAAGFTTTGSLYTYDETVTGGVDFGWVEETTTLGDTRGYTLYMYTGQGGNAFSTTGTLNTGSVSFPVTYTNTGSASDDGWNFVNNPYASSIDWGSGGWTKTNIVANCAVWNGSTYDYFSSGLISSGQGFWVQTNGASPVLTATQSVKSNSSQALQRISEDNELKVFISNGDDVDFARIKFRSDATEEFDAQYDARKLANAIHNVSSLTPGGENLAINTVPESTCDRTISLNLNQADGDYQLYIEGLSSLSAGYTVQLMDNYINTTVDFNSSTIYNFTVDNTDPLTYGEDRFDIILTAITLDQGIEPTYSINNECNTNDAIITLSNLQDGVNYYLTNDKGDVVSNEQVASNNVADLIVDKSAHTADVLYLFTLIGTTDNLCSGSLNYTDLISFEYTSVPEITSVNGADICEGFNGNIRLEATGAPVSGSYRWYLDATTPNPIEGESLSYLTINDASTANSSYYVSAVNESGCEGSRVRVDVNKSQLSSPTTINGIGCSGSSITLEATGAGTDEFYKWYTSMVTSDAILDENSGSLVVSGLSNNKSYYVSIANSNGCESERVEVIAEIETLQSPVITVSGEILSVSGGDTYQWYLNGNPINGATNSSIQVTSSGEYRVEVFKGYCSALSEARQMVITGIDDKLYKLGLSIYPNPVADKLYAKNLNTSISLKLFDLKGNEILNDGDLVKNNEISYFNLSELKSSVYILNIEEENGTVLSLRILKK